VTKAVNAIKAHMAVSNHALLKNPICMDVIGNANIPAPIVVPATISKAPVTRLLEDILIKIHLKFR
jgi:hypothetical protein